jgi:large subunit ribosomal protein L18
LSRETGESRERRHQRIRKKVLGTPERPRLSVYRSLNHVYAQIIDDTKGNTIVAASTLEKELSALKGHKGNVGMAKKVGELIAQRALGKGLKKVVFDRGGYMYHGRVKALADSAREAGLEF